MAYEADRVVVELIAEAQGFDSTVKKSASTFSNSMDAIERSSTKAEKTVASGSSSRAASLSKEADLIRKASDIIGSGFTDLSAILASPNSPFVAPVRQAPAVRNAMGLVTAGASALGGVLGGALVNAAFLAGGALVELAAKHIGLSNNVDDLVDKLKEEAERTRDAEAAQEIFGNTIEGVTAALDANEKALDKLNNTSKTAARRALEVAIAEAEKAQRIRESNVAILKQAEAQLASARAQTFGAAGGAGAAGAVALISGQVEDIKKAIADAEAQVTRAQGQVTEALSRRIVEISDIKSDPLKSIREKYEGRNGLIEAARKAAVAQAEVERKAGNVAKAEQIVTTELQQQILLLERQQKKEEDRERAKQRTARSTREANQQSGRQINVAQAKAIVESIGGTVTSGFRTVQHNEDVGGVKNSFHTKGQAVDIAKTAGLTLDKIVKAFEEKGVRLIEKLDEGDHFHIAFARRGSGRQGPSDETIARRAQAQADASERREQAFQNEKASLEQDELQARQALITSAEEIARLELASIEVARQKYDDNVQSLVTQRKLTADEAAELIKLNDERAKLRAELVQRREAERKFRLQEQQNRANQEVQTAGLQDRAEVLQGEQALANTLAERRDIERKLLDLQFQEERIRLEALIKYNERLKLQEGITESEKIEAEAAAQIAQIRLASIDQRQANAVATSAEQNQSPLQSYFGDIQSQADDLNTAFETIAAGGLANFTDRLTDAIVNFKSLGDVGRAVLTGLTADLVKLAIRMILNATIGRLVAKTTTAAAAAGGPAVAAAWAPAAAAVSLATLGANSGPAIAGIAAANAAAMGFATAAGVGAVGGAFAEGGRIGGSGSSIGDEVDIKASPDEFMLKARSARKIGYSTLDYMNRTGELPTSMLFRDGGRVRAISPVNEPAVAPGRASGGLDGLRSIIGEAVQAGISAMPDVNVYTSLDPVDVLQRALGTPAGVNALAFALGQNKTKMKQTLQ